MFKARIYYIRHRFRSHGLRTKKLTDVADEFSGNKCDVCGTVFKKRNYLLRHRFRQHGLRTRKFLKLKVNEKIKKENLIKVEVEDHLENYVSRVYTKIKEVLKHTAHAPNLFQYVVEEPLVAMEAPVIASGG